MTTFSNTQDTVFRDLTKLTISRNTVSWLFENVVIATTTIVLTDLMTLAE